MTPEFFEDFEVGQRRAGPRAVTEGHPGASGFAAFAEVLRDPAVVPAAALRLVDSGWAHVAPVHVGDTLTCESTVTRCARTGDGDAGVVQRHLRLRDRHGSVVQEGRASFLMPARENGPDRDDRAFGTAGWARALAACLAEDGRFAEATAGWDGTIGLRCGEAETQLRVYRGAVIEAGRRTPLGATFTVGASELTWTELVTGADNDFMRRAMTGEFTVAGNGYEYLRLTKVLALIVDSARVLAREGLPT